MELPVFAAPHRSSSGLGAHLQWPGRRCEEAERTVGMCCPDNADQLLARKKDNVIEKNGIAPYKKGNDESDSNVSISTAFLSQIPRFTL